MSFCPNCGHEQPTGAPRFKVATIEQTCGACPTIYEGALKDGRSWYSRYRYGELRVCVDDQTIHSASLGDGLAGVMSFEDLETNVGHLLDFSEAKWR